MFSVHSDFQDKSVAVDGWTDGWMTCDFTSFSTVFHSYQDDGQMIMIGSVQWNLPRAGLEHGTARSVG